MQLHHAVECGGYNVRGVCAGQEGDAKNVEVMHCVDTKRWTAAVWIVPKNHLQGCARLCCGVAAVEQVGWWPVAFVCCMREAFEDSAMALARRCCSRGKTFKATLREGSGVRTFRSSEPEANLVPSSFHAIRLTHPIWPCSSSDSASHLV